MIRRSPNVDVAGQRLIEHIRCSQRAAVLVVWYQFSIIFIYRHPTVELLSTEGVTELLSHRDNCTSQVVSAFVVGDSDNKSKIETPALVHGRGLGRTHA